MAFRVPARVVRCSTNQGLEAIDYLYLVWHLGYSSSVVIFSLAARARRGMLL